MINQENAVLYMTALVGLTRRIGGVKFIECQDDYDALDVPEQKGTTCYLGRKALDGYHIKADEAHVACAYGAYAVGIQKAPPHIVAGQSYAACGLYRSKGVARSIVGDIHFLDQEIYGLELGPLEEIGDADIAFLACNTRQAMRIFQGYAYGFGAPKNINFFGNQAMCGDLLAKPFYHHDINLSLFCEGARKYGGYTDGEVGISMPGDMFYDVACGVYETVDAVENVREKKAIAQRLSAAGLSYEFDTKPSYGSVLDAYDERMKKLGL